MRLLGPLAADGHDVVVPSLPGFAFSNPIAGVIGPRRAAPRLNSALPAATRCRAAAFSASGPASS